MIDQIGGWSSIGAIGSKYGQVYDLDAVKEQFDAVSLSWESRMVISSDPDLYARSTKYNDAVLGVDSPHPLLPSASSTFIYLATCQFD